MLMLMKHLENLVQHLAELLWGLSPVENTIVRFVD